ncbi:hypothetical protein CRUP_032656 [Coryphaenoides rupestris]|nr:hypothetical protein CRUP_032656 [Coryphaenoides rupestris]
MTTVLLDASTMMFSSCCLSWVCWYHSRVTSVSWALGGQRVWIDHADIRGFKVLSEVLRVRSLVTLLFLFSNLPLEQPVDAREVVCPNVEPL